MNTNYISYETFLYVTIELNNLRENTFDYDKSIFVIPKIF